MLIIGMNIGENIRAARLGRGFSQSKLGKIVNIHYVTIGRYEKGIRDIPSQLLLKIANALNVTIEQLQHGIPDDPPPRPYGNYNQKVDMPVNGTVSAGAITDRDVRADILKEIATFMGRASNRQLESLLKMIKCYEDITGDDDTEKRKAEPSSPPVVSKTGTDGDSGFSQ